MIAGYMREIRVRPVGAPNTTIRCGCHQRLNQRRHIRIVRPLNGAAIADQLEPDMIEPRQPEQHAKSRRLHPVRGAHETEMIDHAHQRRLCNYLLDLREMIHASEKLQVPAEPFDPPSSLHDLLRYVRWRKLWPGDADARRAHAGSVQ